MIPYDFINEYKVENSEQINVLSSSMHTNF